MNLPEKHLNIIHPKSFLSNFWGVYQNGRGYLTESLFQ